MHPLHVSRVWQTGALDELNDPDWAVKVGQPVTKVGQFVPKIYRFQTAPVFGDYDGLVSNAVHNTVCVCNVHLAYA